MALPTYSTGTASVAAGGTVVTGAGGLWSGTNAKQGDFLSINGLATVLITEVTDSTHLKIEKWTGAAQTSQPYIIYQNYVGRVVGVAAAEDVGTMLEKLHIDGLPFIVDPALTVPDPSYGDDGQFAFQPTTGLWWTKTGGVWVSSPGLTSDASKVAKAGDTMTGALHITNATASSSTTTGALTVIGGAGVAGALNVGGAATIGAALSMPWNSASIELGLPGTSNTPFIDFHSSAFSPDYDVRLIAGGGSSTAGNGTLSMIAAIVNPICKFYVTPNSAPVSSATCAAQIGYAGGATMFGMGFRPQADTTTQIIFYNAAGTQVGSITETSTATAFNTSSDARLKEDLQPFDAGPIIDQIEVHDFKWKSTGERAYGVVAQEVEAVFPDVVHHDETNDTWGIDYSTFVPLLLQEVKALRARVAQLEAGAT